MILGLVSMIVLIAVLCSGIYALAIYALPVLGGLAIYSAAQQLGLPPVGSAAASVVGGALTLAAARVGAAASHRPVRVAALALIAVPAGYAGFVATSQLAAVAGFSAEAQLALAAITGLVVGGLGVERLGQSKH